MLEPYWLQEGVRLGWFGPLWAGTLLTVGLFGRAAPFISEWFSARGALLLLTFGPVVGYAAMGWSGGVIGITAGYLFYVSRGLNSVVLVEAFNHHVPSSLRATFNSLQSGIFRLGYGLIGPTIGAVIDSRGLTASLQLLAAGFLIAFLLAGVPLVWFAPTVLARQSSERIS